ncbi:uncharacterized protein MYCFIDRAFT_178753 [Pseudocercospora fijiensis CIRAD86]|uniref:Uncharacterized protein n=1 Tax=Pseudocercospora fijiensis (strain CIRAD86) TaxID=383855 RepID=M3AME7_PSEFD|nr:uncharacterized protein MYCFIDRAFT_178753 [Pseudocercospora fijiensis CIRAD86]EME78637.1 hypothetical protein MYCFIDRAFT_178753 [Pseudocercospora fijiensis CIRAD86]
MNGGEGIPMHRPFHDNVKDVLGTKCDILVEPEAREFGIASGWFSYRSVLFEAAMVRARQGMMNVRTTVQVLIVKRIGTFSSLDFPRFLFCGLMTRLTLEASKFPKADADLFTEHSESVEVVDRTNGYIDQLRVSAMLVEIEKGREGEMLTSSFGKTYREMAALGGLALLELRWDRDTVIDPSVFLSSGYQAVRLPRGWDYGKMHSSTRRGGMIHRPRRRNHWSDRRVKAIYSSPLHLLDTIGFAYAMSGASVHILFVRQQRHDSGKPEVAFFPLTTAADGFHAVFGRADTIVAVNKFVQTEIGIPNICGLLHSSGPLLHGDSRLWTFSDAHGTGMPKYSEAGLPLGSSDKLSYFEVPLGEVDIDADTAFPLLIKLQSFSKMTPRSFHTLRPAVGVFPDQISPRFLIVLVQLHLRASHEILIRDSHSVSPRSAVCKGRAEQRTTARDILKSGFFNDHLIHHASPQPSVERERQGQHGSEARRVSEVRLIGASSLQRAIRSGQVLCWISDTKTRMTVIWSEHATIARGLAHSFTMTRPRSRHGSIGGQNECMDSWELVYPICFSFSIERGCCWTKLAQYNQAWHRLSGIVWSIMQGALPVGTAARPHLSAAHPGERRLALVRARARARDEPLGSSCRLQTAGWKCAVEEAWVVLTRDAAAVVCVATNVRSAPSASATCAVHMDVMPTTASSRGLCCRIFPVAKHLRQLQLASYIHINGATSPAPPSFPAERRPDLRFSNRKGRRDPDLFLSTSLLDSKPRFTILPLILISYSIHGLQPACHMGSLSNLFATAHARSGNQCLCLPTRELIRTSTSTTSGLGKVTAHYNSPARTDRLPKVRVMADPRQQPRPAYFSRKISSYFFPQVARDGEGLVARPDPPTERTPLLEPPTSIPTITISTSDNSDNRPLSHSIADASIHRPHLLRAATTVAAVHTEVASTVAPTFPTRPELGRAKTTTTAFLDQHTAMAGISSMDRNNPSLFRRATQAITQTLDLTDQRAHRNAPKAPSNWNDHAHRRYLVKIWDSVNDVTANSSKYPKSITAQLRGNSARPDAREFIEYVLGVALRHPFCTQEKMGRWEVLASSGSQRMNWGPCWLKKNRCSWRSTRLLISDFNIGISKQPASKRLFSLNSSLHGDRRSIEHEWHDGRYAIFGPRMNLWHEF